MRISTAARKCTAAALSVAFLWTLAPLGAYGQSVATPRSAAGASSSFASFDAVTDVITGNNTRGPYFLAWRKVDQGSEVVAVGTGQLTRGDDYAIDCASGVLSFTRSIPAGSVIRVSYRLKQGISEKNAATASLPIKLDLAQGERGGLSIVGLYKQNQRAARSPAADGPGIGVFGISGSRKFGKSAETSTLFLTGAGDGSQDRTFWGRSAMTFGASAGSQKLSFKATYTRAGEEFAGSKEYGLQKGMEVANAAISMNPSDRLSVMSSVTRSADIGGVGKGAESLATESSVAYSPSKATRIIATHATQDVGTASGARNSVVTDKVQLNQQFGNTSAAASIEQRAVDTPGGSDTVLTQRVDVNSAPSDAIKFRASVAHESYQSKGEDTSGTVQVVAKPLPKIGLQMDYAARESDFAADEQVHKVIVEAQPISGVKVGGGIGQRFVGDKRDISKEARLEVVPFEKTTIAGAYVFSGSGATASSSTEVTAATKPADFVEMSGKYKTRESTLAEKPDSLGVDFALRPVRFISFFGKYQRNPEEKPGIVSLLDMRSVGMKTQIGSLGLLGGYSVSEDFGAGRETTAREYGLSLKMFGHGELTTGYKETLMLAGMLYGTKQYTLGYVHNVGSDFNLTIAGAWTQRELERRMLQDQTEYEAQAKLGLRF